MTQTAIAYIPTPAQTELREEFRKVLLGSLPAALAERTYQPSRGPTERAVKAFFDLSPDGYLDAVDVPDLMTQVLIIEASGSELSPYDPASLFIPAALPPGSPRPAAVALGGSLRWEADGGHRATIRGAALIVGEPTAAYLMVRPRRYPGLGFACLDRAASEVEVCDAQTCDDSRGLSMVRAEGAVPVKVQRPGDGGERVEALATLFVAADSVGGAGRALDEAVRYACTRYQFGKPIGSFQAIKHMLVNTHIAVESARSALYYAAWRLTVADETAHLFVSAAKVLADRAYQIAAGRYIQVLGGLGFTMEMPGHLFARRAMFNQQSMGAPDVHLGQIAQRFADSGSRS